MLLQDPLLTAISFLSAPVIFYVIGILLRKLKELGKEELAGYAELNKNVRETVQGITVVKAFNLEPTLRGKTDEVISGLQWRKNRIAALRAIPIPLMDTIGGVAVAVAILYAGFRTVWGGYDPGTFMSFVTALLLAADPARRLSQMRVTLRTSFIAVNTMFSLLNNDQSESSGSQKLKVSELGPSRVNDDISEEPIIVFRDVHFSYGEGAPVLSGLDLEIAPGEMVALVGPSGAGKSTVFKLLLKLYQPGSGQISINGVTLPQIDLVSLRDTISFVGQSNFIFSGSIRDNIALGNTDVSPEAIEAACATVGLHDFVLSLPKGYDTDVGELGSMISGGQAQRLNLARAIVKDAPILLLDEVTSALDAENERLIKSYIQQQARKKTVLVIAHRLSTVIEADRIAIMDGGRIIDAGGHQQLLSANSYYEKIVSLQFSQ
jgi:ATP-binding cassette subfamily B protein